MSRLVPPVLLLSCVCLWLATPAAAQQVRRCTDARGNSVFTDRSCDSQDAVPSEGARSGFGTGTGAVGDNLGASFGNGAYGPASIGSYASGFGRLGCARSPGRLLDGVRASIQARDVNRLASYYHWTGTGSRTGVHLMDRLEDIVARPLVSADLLYPFAATPEAAFPALGPAQPGDPPAPGAASSGPAHDPNGASAPNANPGFRAQATFPSRDGRSPAASPPGDTASVADTPGSPAPAPDTAGAPAAPTPNPPGPPPYGLLLEQMSGDNDAGSHQTRFSLQRNAGCWWVEL